MRKFCSVLVFLPVLPFCFPQSVMEELKFGLNKFEVDQPPYREIEDVQKEIVLLERAWTVARDWDREWLSVKDAVFSNLNVDQLETAVEGV